MDALFLGALSLPEESVVGFMQGIILGQPGLL